MQQGSWAILIVNMHIGRAGRVAGNHQLIRQAVVAAENGAQRKRTAITRIVTIDG